MPRKSGRRRQSIKPKQARRSAKKRRASAAQKRNHTLAAKAMRLHHSKRISLKAAWREVRKSNHYYDGQDGESGGTRRSLPRVVLNVPEKRDANVDAMIEMANRGSDELERLTVELERLKTEGALLEEEYEDQLTLVPELQARAKELRDALKTQKRWHASATDTSLLERIQFGIKSMRTTLLGGNYFANEEESNFDMLYNGLKSLEANLDEAYGAIELIDHAIQYMKTQLHSIEALRRKVDAMKMVHSSSGKWTGDSEKAIASSTQRKHTWSKYTQDKTPWAKQKIENERAKSRYFN